MPSIADRIANRKQRWLNLYDPAQPPTSLFMIRYMNELGDRPFPRLDNLPDRVDWAWRKYQLMLEQLTWLEDDSIPYLDLYTGTEIFAAAFGCPVYYPDQDMPFAMPGVQTAEEAESVQVPGLDHPAIVALFQIADELRRRAEEWHARPGQSVDQPALLRLVDIQSPMDIAALIWNKVTFYQALVENPAAVEALSQKVYTFLTQFLDTWFRRYGQEFLAHYPDYYMPNGITLSEDEIGAVSGKMFNQFFLPELTALSKRYGNLGIHCCAHARHQWNHIKKIPGLKLLNLNQPPEVTREAWTFFNDLCVQNHNYQGEGPAWTWPAQHPPEARMVYEIWVGSKEEAIETSAKMRSVLNRENRSN